MFKKDDKVVDFRTKDQKRFERQMKAKRIVDSTFGWIRDNKDVLMLVVPPLTAGIAGGTKIVSKAITNHTVSKELRDQERRIYDHSLGRYTYLKRPLRPAEALTIEERKANGEKLNMILEDMIVSRFGKNCEGLCAVDLKRVDGTKYGHAFNFKVKDGVAEFMDYRHGRNDSYIAADYFKRIDLNGQLTLARLDGAEPVWDAIMKYARNAI